MLAKILRRTFIKGVIKDNMRVKKLFTDFGTEAIEEVSFINLFIIFFNSLNPNGKSELSFPFLSFFSLN